MKVQKNICVSITPGQSWVIPAGSLHSLNNVANTQSVMIISWNGDAPNTFDLPVIYNSLPSDIAIDYTKPKKHQALVHYRNRGPPINQ